MSSVSTDLRGGAKTVAIAVVLLGSTAITARILERGLVSLGFGGLTTGTAGVGLFAGAFTLAFAALLGGIALWQSRRPTNERG
ncbi:hypothetical protein HASA104033_05685 [Halobacterium salinarum]|uniref:Uncharacterized protein n=1 Tax=Halobacterium salinarum (strain ATCC 33171 / DSM 3754 / JCM 8978 / NBRC 102687 / NCIMB 764 / 91-R6) TaxID=2597657 RepID=A0A663A8S3_HALS9|nr:hypothetical protein APQ99_01445 [Halobacterium salinarum DSM 3754]